MPVPHIGLTVAHLPTSCSFFLAALQPLGYRYIGCEDHQIGFGVKEHADFFICQKTPGKDPGAAHIAFTAPSRPAVDAFFIAALKAGGRIHGEPALRRPSTDYYSAAVIDLDSNAIEVVHRESFPQPPPDDKAASARHSDVSSGSGSRVLTWRQDVARSNVGVSVSDAPPLSMTVARSSPLRAIACSHSHALAPTPTPLFTAPAPITTPTPGASIPSKALIGTLLGAAAGAAIAYAMTQGEAQSVPRAQQQQQQQRGHRHLDQATTHRPALETAPPAPPSNTPCSTSFSRYEPPHQHSYPLYSTASASASSLPLDSPSLLARRSVTAPTYAAGGGVRAIEAAPPAPPNTGGAGGSMMDGLALSPQELVRYTVAAASAAQRFLGRAGVGAGAGMPRAASAQTVVTGYGTAYGEGYGEGGKGNGSVLSLSSGSVRSVRTARTVRQGDYMPVSVPGPGTGTGRALTARSLAVVEGVGGGEGRSVLTASVSPSDSVSQVGSRGGRESRKVNGKVNGKGQELSSPSATSQSGSRSGEKIRHGHGHGHGYGSEDGRERGGHGHRSKSRDGTMTGRRRRTGEGGGGGEAKGERSLVSLPVRGVEMDWGRGEGKRKGGKCG